MEVDAVLVIYSFPYAEQEGEKIEGTEKTQQDRQISYLIVTNIFINSCSVPLFVLLAFTKNVLLIRFMKILPICKAQPFCSTINFSSPFSYRLNPVDF